MCSPCRYITAALLVLLTWPAAASVAATPDEARHLESLVGPVALYPDDLLAVVLAASAHPGEIVEADLYLQDLQEDPDAGPDPGWDPSVVALLNYPEVVSLLADDVAWTRDLGQEVATQQPAVLAAVARFRRAAHAAGNLVSDERQHVEVIQDVVEIRPADPAVIYVPYYEPAVVRRRHSYRVYHYYSRPCPVYYYPYPAEHWYFSRYRPHFWGLTSAFTIGWQSRHLRFHHLAHRGHPYFGHPYAFRHYRYWQPRLHSQHRLPYDRRLGDHDRGYHPANRWRPDYPIRGARPLPRRRHLDEPRHLGATRPFLRSERPAPRRAPAAEDRFDQRHSPRRHQSRPPPVARTPPAREQPRASPAPRQPQASSGNRVASKPGKAARQRAAAIRQNRVAAPGREARSGRGAVKPR